MEHATILASVRRYLAERSGEVIIAELYGFDTILSVDASSQLGELLRTIAQELPDVQQLILKEINTLEANTLERLILVRAGLLAVRGNTLWLHYHAVVLLNQLGGIGMPGTHLPLAIHGMLAMLNIAEADFASNLIGDLLARSTLNLSPVDSMRFALSSIDHGGRDAVWMLQRAFASRLGLDAPETHLQRVGEARRLTGDERPSVLLAPVPDGPIVQSASTLRLTMPEGDAYYLFTELRLRRERPAIRIHEIEGGTISVRQNESAPVEFYVFDAAGRCIEELSSGYRPFIDLDVHVHPNQLGLISDLFSQKFNVCHFLLDHCSRIALYQKCRSDDVSFLSMLNIPYCQQAFDLLGVGDRILLPDKAQFSVRADKLLISSNLSQDFRHPAHFCDDWAIEFLRRLVPQIQNRNRRIFISRADASSRKILNWQDIVPILSRFGFEVIALDGLHLAEQASMFGEATAVVGVHGAGLTNLLFSTRGTAVLEILPALAATDAYWILSGSLGLRYYPFVADDPEFERPDYSLWQHNPIYNDRDIIIDPDRFTIAVQRLIGRSVGDSDDAL